MRARATAGFTLVELLVALVIMGFISLMLASSLHTGIMAWHRTDALDATSGDLLSSRTLLEDRVGFAYPYYDLTDPTAPLVRFEGTEDHMVFLAPTPLAIGGAGFARYRLSIEADETGARLMLAASREQAWDDTAEPSPLVERAAAITLDYFGADEGDGSLRWQASWTNRRRLPRLIRIRVQFGAGDLRVWPDLIIAPRIAEDVNCVYDALTFQCRGR